jgi:LmbE family N-acetylglucosaminyl deacetylase
VNIQKNIKNITSAARSLLRITHYSNFISLVKSNLEQKVIVNVQRAKVLVLSAQPEDVSIGCAGALIKHIKQEDRVKILFLSDGSLGFPANIRPSLSERKKMAQTRENETVKAASAIGVKDLQFWRFAQGSIQANKTTIKLMQGVLNTYKPELIYCPFPLETDHDRLEAAKILYEGLRLSDSKAKIFCYETWNALVANAILDISPQIDDKIEALLNHKSQIGHKNLVEAAKGLSSYRSINLVDGKFAEAFFCCTADYYLKIFFQLYQMRYKNR